MRSRTLCALGLLLAVLASGCSKHHRLQIQSDTCWDGLINDTDAISDCGTVTYKILGPFQCAKVQKQTAVGYLRIRVDNGLWSETREPNGLLQVCQ